MRDNQRDTLPSQVADRLSGPEADTLRTAAEQLKGYIGDLRETSHRNANLLQWASELAGLVAQWLLGYQVATPAYTRTGVKEAAGQVSARDWSA